MGGCNWLLILRSNRRISVSISPMALFSWSMAEMRFSCKTNYEVRWKSRILSDITRTITYGTFQMHYEMLSHKIIIINPARWLYFGNEIRGWIVILLKRLRSWLPVRNRGWKKLTWGIENSKNPVYFRIWIWIWIFHRGILDFHLWNGIVKSIPQNIKKVDLNSKLKSCLIPWT